MLLVSFVEAPGLLDGDLFSVVGRVSFGVVCAVIGGDLTISKSTMKAIEKHHEKGGTG